MFCSLVNHKEDGALRILVEEGFYFCLDLVLGSRLGFAFKVDLFVFSKDDRSHVPSYGVRVLDGGERKVNSGAIDQAGTDEERDSQDKENIDNGSHVEKVEEPGVAFPRKIKAMVVPGSRHFPFPG